MGNSKSPVRLTIQNLQHLKDKGFLYVLIKGYTRDGRVDYIELDYFTLIPVKSLPDDPNKKEIYEPIDSTILTGWANFPDEGLKIFIEEERQ
ncbi:hypothetical protein Q4E93_16605 [Flavitalea sp. BT771]|uniref:hypothetical protein n=1 Tax=Flavitalea sp. BT771 TaxID=3063329 RepID=UPI0026E13AAD|nr:hypothetical protein [Flavitalea sp. BT771]MDO6432224.1 hypothetical protein [Flavitalea sp. BT771]MDV6221134.1 hypothetical protein [Flavitalea sp. BT771]